LLCKQRVQALVDHPARTERGDDDRTRQFRVPRSGFRVFGRLTCVSHVRPQ
jgi:hypothetical protein